MDTMLAGGGDFVGFLIAVLVLAGLSAAGNRVKKWWEGVTKSLKESVEQQKALQQSRTGGGPRPVRPNRPISPSMKRPVIVEKLPEGAPGRSQQTTWQPNPRPKGGAEQRGPRPARPGSAPSPAGAGVEKASASTTGRPPQQVTAIAQEVLDAAKRAEGVAGQVAAPSVGAEAFISLKGMSRDQLCRAIVLNEVMSPPLALREEYS